MRFLAVLYSPRIRGGLEDQEVNLRRFEEHQRGDEYFDTAEEIARRRARADGFRLAKLIDQVLSP